MISRIAFCCADLADAIHLAQPVGCPFDDVKHLLPEAMRQLAGRRMRRLRARDAAGSVRVVFYLSAEGIGPLTELGWLGQTDRQNPAAIWEACARFLNAAGAARLNPDNA